jgi:hypothetical protein
MEALADLMDRGLRPDGGGDSEAGKAIFRQITAAARAQMEQAKQVKDRQPRLQAASKVAPGRGV